MAAGTKRVKNKRITRRFIIGSEAWRLDSTNRPPNTPADHTNGWRVYVRPFPGDPCLSAWLSKVSFKIFQTYPNPNRTIEQEPFEVNETGWGGFNVDIRLIFQPYSSEKAQYRQHYLQLERFGTEAERKVQEEANMVRSELVEFIEFNEPTEALWDALTDESQWDYLEAKNVSSKATSSTRGVNKGGFEKTMELPDNPTPGNPYSKQMENHIIEQLRKAELEVQELLEKELRRKGELEKELTELGGMVPASVTGAGRKR
ncbi:yeats-domain-containing protein [Patellaria atrata CBS 101060]|uniref:Protein AF-9 homolog n=1 Tax=Patellaria atrata CBS 101060 TaxID=1346257 RepID=A0A9P4SI22_9PEZI|nr:yeats-domain-containing protein [Patellaria atrata CBS 101060]